MWRFISQKMLKDTLKLFFKFSKIIEPFLANFFQIFKKCAQCVLNDLIAVSLCIGLSKNTKLWRLSKSVEKGKQCTLGKILEKYF
jgi:hypothetical protein